MKSKIELPEEIYTDVNRILEITGTLQKGMGNIDEERHALLKSLKQLKEPSAAELALISEIEKSEEAWRAERSRREHALYAERSELYEKVRCRVRDTFVGKYVTREYGDGTMYTYINRVNMYWGGKVTMVGPRIVIHKEDGKVTRGTTEDNLFAIDTLKPNFCLSAGLKYDILYIIRNFEFCELSDVTEHIERLRKETMAQFDELKCHTDQWEHLKKPEDSPCHPEDWY